MAAEDIEVGFEEGMLCLPSHVFDEAICDAKVYSKLQMQKNQHLVHLNSKVASRPQHRARASVNWSSGGPGMRAVFLDSSKKSSGTGVFLPQRAGTNFNKTKKPACAPVLLPSRVVQALNLNVQKLGLQISPRQDHKRKARGDYISAPNKVNGNKEVSSKQQCYIISQSSSSSPELFLPKEWTY